MTELEQKAEEYAKECFPNDEFKQAMVEDGCLKFYTQGKETTIKLIDDICTALNKQNIQKFAELESDNNSLRDCNRRTLEKVIELKAQIERMKCCAICKSDTLYADEEPCKSCFKKNHWELAEWLMKN